jgi:hypothetical protein
MAMRKALLIPSILLSVLAIMAHGQSTSTITELDPAIAVAIELNKKVRLDLYAGREKSEEIESGKDKIGAGISFRVKPIFKRFLDAIDTDKQHLVVFGATYEYSVATEKTARSIEHKVMLDATLRYTLPHDLLLSNRNRSELRWVNGKYHFRYRNRPMLELPLKLRKRDLTPYVATEAYWDQRYHKWNLFKFSAGLGVPIARRVSLDFLYERQHCVTCTDANTNIFGLTLNISVKLKRK